jgi:hypothetical protein
VYNCSKKAFTIAFLTGQRCCGCRHRSPRDAAKAVTQIIGLNADLRQLYCRQRTSALVVLDRDLNVKSYVAFPGEAVDNRIDIDERNGIYVATSRRMQGYLND